MPNLNYTILQHLLIHNHISIIFLLSFCINLYSVPDAFLNQFYRTILFKSFDFSTLKPLLQQTSFIMQIFICKLIILLSRKEHSFLLISAQCLVCIAFLPPVSVSGLISFCQFLLRQMKIACLNNRQ